MDVTEGGATTYTLWKDLLLLMSVHFRCWYTYSRCFQYKEQLNYDYNNWSRIAMERVIKV